MRQCATDEAVLRSTSHVRTGCVHSVRLRQKLVAGRCAALVRWPAVWLASVAPLQRVDREIAEKIPLKTRQKLSANN
jgi:hypothetical protein